MLSWSRCLAFGHLDPSGRYSTYKPKHGKWKQDDLSAPHNYTLRYPIYKLIGTIRPLIELLGGVPVCYCSFLLLMGLGV